MLDEVRLGQDLFRAGEAEHKLQNVRESDGKVRHKVATYESDPQNTDQ